MTMMTKLVKLQKGEQIKQLEDESSDLYRTRGVASQKSYSQSEKSENYKNLIICNVGYKRGFCDESGDVYWGHDILGVPSLLFGPIHCKTFHSKQNINPSTPAPVLHDKYRIHQGRVAECWQYSKATQLLADDLSILHLLAFCLSALSNCSSSFPLPHPSICICIFNLLLLTPANPFSIVPDQDSKLINSGSLPFCTIPHFCKQPIQLD